ncbi:CAP domain-containing protein [Strongyloides ratti]|nr:CAP domain-containing protein [Strongyloides ratti]CEF63571.1 CAP domain-containing protein [Strongyloides ratti]
MFSKFIHDRIWGSCDHDCASKNNFKEFKKRSLEELNEYRKLHYANKLYTSESLDKIAQKEADRYIKTKGDQTCKLKDDYGCVTSKLYKTFITFFIQTLYDELLLTYRWKKKYLKRKHLHLVQLIWRKAKYIGIGIAKEKDCVYLVLAFSSKVKTHSGYKYNVLPIRNKYILKYRNLI